MASHHTAGQAFPQPEPAFLLLPLTVSHSFFNSHLNHASDPSPASPALLHAVVQTSIRAVVTTPPLFVSPVLTVLMFCTGIQMEG